jgi:predicted ATPase
MTSLQFRTSSDGKVYRQLVSADDVTEEVLRTALEATPAYWLKELVTELKMMNATLVCIDGRLQYMADLYGNSGRR